MYDCLLFEIFKVIAIKMLCFDFQMEALINSFWFVELVDSGEYNILFGMTIMEQFQKNCQFWKS